MHQLRNTVLVVALGVLVSACGQGASSATPTASPSPVSAPPTPEPTPMPRAVDLVAIVVAKGAPPSGLVHDNTVEGPTALVRLVVSRRASQFSALDGFTAGRYSEFSGERGVLLSLGLLFDTVDNAERAFDLYLDELLSDEGYGAGSGIEAGLGGEGTCAEFDNPALGGLHENACIWRNGNLVLAAGGTLAPEEIHSIAEGMDASASSQLEP